LREIVSGVHTVSEVRGSPEYASISGGKLLVNKLKL